MLLPILAERKFSCLVCHRSYSNKYRLNQHVKVHDVSKCFKCDVCLKVFANKYLLKMHYRTHTGEKPFSCQICDAKFALKSNLVRHQVTHSQIKSFKCSICPEGRFFKTKQNLNLHMAFHYEPKFYCSQCDYKFHFKNDLNKHEKTHSKTKH